MAEVTPVDPARAVPSARVDVLTTFGSTAEDCARPPDPRAVEASRTHYLVVVEPGADPIVVERGVTVTHRYDHLSILEVDTTAEVAYALQARPGVIKVVPALGNVDRARSFAVGLDLVTGIAVEQRNQTRPALYGGREVGSPIGYPVLTRIDAGWTLEPDPALDWPAPAAIIPVVNVSVGPSSAAFPFLANDIVNLATMAAAREVLMVVAAGNCGELGVSPWARGEWVLSVGASADPEGTELADYSSRGDPGPDLIAYGTIQDGGRVLTGTSYAAPRVCAMARLVTAAFAQLGRQVRLAAGAPPHGVPLVGFAVVDDFGTGVWMRHLGLTVAAALPIVGVDTDAVAALTRVVTLDVVATPFLLREILLSAATPVPGRGPFEVGAGFVDDARVIRRLAAVNGSDLARWFGGGVADPGLAEIRPFDADQLAVLNLVLQATGPAYSYDYRTRRMGCAPILDMELNTLTLDERIHGLENG